MITTPAIEPEATPWRCCPLEGLLSLASAALDTPSGRPAILAVDGRSASGKTTIASRLASAMQGAVVVGSDDVAWWESFFGWDGLMANGVLEPLRRGEDVSYRPPAWDDRERQGAIVVSASARLVIVEGVGVSRRSLVPLLDGAIWVQSDVTEARARGIARDGDDQAAIDFWDEWGREELPFLAHDRPWERALAVICGTPELAGVAFDAANDVLIGRDLRR